MPALRLRSLVLAALGTCSWCAAQTASFTTYGTSCSVQGRAPAIGALNLPRVGTTFTVTYTGPNFTVNNAQQRAWPFLITGLSQTQVPVPPVLPQQPNGCTLLAAPDVVTPMPPDPTLQGRFADRFDWVIPGNRSLLGATWYQQWLVVFDQCGFAGCDPQWALLSEGGKVVVGL